MPSPPFIPTPAQSRALQLFEILEVLFQDLSCLHTCAVSLYLKEEGLGASIKEVVMCPAHSLSQQDLVALIKIDDDFVNETGVYPTLEAMSDAYHADNITCYPEKALSYAPFDTTIAGLIWEPHINNLVNRLRAYIQHQALNDQTVLPPHYRPGLRL